MKWWRWNYRHVFLDGAYAHDGPGAPHQVTMGGDGTGDGFGFEAVATTGDDVHPRGRIGIVWGVQSALCSRLR